MVTAIHQNEIQYLPAVGQWTWDIETGHVTWSSEIYQILGVSALNYEPSYEKFMDFLHPEDQERVTSFLQNISQEQALFKGLEHRIVRSTGEVRHLVSYASSIHQSPEGKSTVIAGTLVDITETITAKKEASELHEFYNALSQCNNAIIHAKNEDELFKSICEAALLHGDIKFAWIGIVDNSNQKLNFVAHSGVGIEYLRKLDICLKEGDPSGNGPSGISIRSNKPYWTQDFMSDPNTLAWQNLAKPFDWRGSASLPIRKKGKAIGALTLYTNRVNAFTEAMKTLLTELAGNLSFALDNFEKAKQRETAIQASRKAEKANLLAQNQLEGILEAIPDLLFELDLEGRYIYAHHHRSEQLEIPISALLNKTVADILPNEAAGIVMSAIAEANQHNWSEGKIFQLESSSGKKWFELSVAKKKIPSNKKTHFIAISRDITRRIEAEKKRELAITRALEAEQHIVSISEYTLRQIGLELHDDLGQTLAVASMLAQNVLKQQKPLTKKMEPLVNLVTILNQSVEKVRSISHELYANEINDGGLIQIIESLVKRLTENHHIEIKFTHNTNHVNLPEDTAVNLYRIVQEALSNAIKHSKASKIIIAATLEKKLLTIDVADNGIGIKYHEDKKTGMGLRSMHYRAQQAQAKLSITGSENAGTEINIQISV